MNVRKHFAIAFALLALALGFNTIEAQAQPLLKGTFELPAAAYWGNTLLQPGQYTIWMSAQMRDLVHTPVIHITGEGINVTYLAVAEPARESGRNILDVAQIGGTYYIRGFDAGVIGESFTFGVTKSVKNKALRASLETADPIAVATE